MSGSALPLAAILIATLATDVAGSTYQLVASGSSPGFAVDNITGEVTRTGTPMAPNSTYTLVVQSAAGAARLPKPSSSELGPMASTTLLAEPAAMTSSMA